MEERKSIYIALLFVFITFLKVIATHYFCFGYIAVRSLWNEPMEFFLFYIEKLYPILLISSFIFLFHNKWWTIVGSLFIDIWIVSNLIYFRSYGLFINLDVISMAGNLSGFTSSILAYCNWKIIVFLVLTVVYAICIYCIGESGENKKYFLFSFLMTFALYGLSYCMYTGKVFPTNERRLVQVKKMAEGESPISMSHYVESSSILHYFPTMFIYQKYRYDFIAKQEDVSFTTNEKQWLLESITNKDNYDTANTYLYIILVESLEDWAVSFYDESGALVMPNVNSLINEDHTLYCSKIKSQALYGNSGDGQMIVNTGMLPISNGAACMLYGKNTFPNLGHFYHSSTCVNAVSNNVWNQYDMNRCYGYSNYVFPQGKTSVQDETVIELSINSIDKNELSCMQIITISTHVPFHSVGNVNLPFKTDMPQMMKDYLNCTHYADSCIGVFINKLKCDSLWEQSTIVITGDHTVFKENILQEFAPFASKYGYDIPQKESYCPLIISSPNIKRSIQYKELCYQMDIFPTILNSIGVENYFWKGFGVNILDSTARTNRKISEKDAYNLSDKMIRINYFKQ